MAKLPQIGIIGSGVIGLLSAQTLAEAGYPVAIVAREFPDDESLDWASPWAGAFFGPVIHDTQGRDLQIASFEHYWALAHRSPTSGVQTVTVTELHDDKDSDDEVWYKTLTPHYRRLPESDLPAGIKLGYSYTSMTINPACFLPWMKKRLDKMGVQFIRGTVSDFAEARKMTGAKIIVNASGLGAASLAKDKDVVAIRGQTMLVKSDFNRVVFRQGSEWAYAIPRMYTGAVVLGGVTQHGNLDRKVDTEVKSGILHRINRVTNNSFADVTPEKIIRDIVAFRPGRNNGYRLEREDNVVHAYGFGAYGYIYSGGVAPRVKELVESIVPVAAKL